MENSILFTNGRRCLDRVTGQESTICPVRSPPGQNSLPRGTAGDLRGHLAKLCQDNPRGQRRAGLFSTFTVVNTVTRAKSIDMSVLLVSRGGGEAGRASNVLLRGSHSHNTESLAYNLEFFTLSFLSLFNFGESNPRRAHMVSLGSLTSESNYLGLASCKLSFPRKLKAKSASAGGCLFPAKLPDENFTHREGNNIQLLFIDVVSILKVL